MESDKTRDEIKIMSAGIKILICINAAIALILLIQGAV